MKGIELTKQEVALLTNAGEELCAAAGLQPPPPPPVVAAPARSLEVVGLGNKKHASVSRAEGALVVRLEARGAEEKGISLSPSDWATVAASVPAVSEALGRRDVAFSVQLSGSRRVTISDWNGATYVQVREFYEKYGKQLPGNKGLGMNPTEWAVLAAAVERLSGALARAQGTV
ncbi:hypothetical protein HYH03_008519 [Edaphochlamys debaryana]|uniref:Transcriptional coactivator p15 (PC4) C-terminal domain-containing protein n=1 Tax=Edaphochlamys debaryana TaxID=47281 RepID=A0A835Y2C1_9CHLO|nr:hypothetical protein HYH03_008519 [Edaphochlamys debaryana]|eukprot:KAG2493388.1 hypothetical protein HYH03_008519 [Edaphochlamys debaryana]